ncbi:ABC transporter permease [Mycolicibacterium chubuense]|uniref:Trehalose transport system permease protein SugA n=1 Tax=Mycolicibacterium chubuense TaxID=1800 RepID=A0A0J6VQR3_MYCCU|nr:sugar ABC transporter permease [Mycolicibacterium chubuense]KMO71823.1 Trehalose transport system permease protein SugA [Mycolicibacterium chubuense]ORA53996.1 ABC transporter permease [Mycolicibacterium chubuense]SPX95516.1 carbohydrate ABC transporter membrane protein 1, CUT1 family [Mycolicibacterium chubuense]
MTQLESTRSSAPGQNKPGKPAVSERVRGERRLGMYLTLPSYLVMILVTAYPLGYALVLSLYNFRLTDPQGRSFVGLSNYLVILTDPVWWQDFLTTFVITVVTVAVELVVGFGFAFVMLRIVRGRGPLRTAILIPYGIVTVVSAFIWRYAFAIDAGFVNQWLNLGAFDWFGDRWSAIFVICLSEIWKTTPFISLLLLAGLVQVPEDMQEAAKVDGATAWQRLWKITLPNMKAAIMVALLFRTLDAWRIFDNPYVMTNGANNTETISFLAYRQNVTLVNLGMGSAVSVVLFFTVVVIAWIFIKVFKTDLSQVRGDA